MKAAVANLDEQRLLKQVRIVYKAMQGAERDEVHARESAAGRRLELGKLLIAAREHWPARGPRAKGWGEFLRRAELDEDVALNAMKYAGFIEKTFPGKRPGKLPTLAEAGIRRASLTLPEPESEAPEPDRGAWCTPAPIAKAVGPWDLDPFSNPRSHIIASVTCELERNDNGLVPSAPGMYYRHGHGTARADENTRTWLQPDYGYVLAAIEHYKHTQFCALLRLDPSTGWFEVLHGCSELILIPKGDRIQFEPPPGVEASSNPYPHGLFYRRASDATEEIRALCYEWRVAFRAA